MLDQTTDEAGAALRRGRELAGRAMFREAVDLLTDVNRRHRSTEIERELVLLRRSGGAALPLCAGESRDPIVPEVGDGTVVEIAADQLDAAALRNGLARSGCLLVRGLVTSERARGLAAGMDAALAGYDAAVNGSGAVDVAWYDPHPMPDRESSNLPEDVHRQFLRGRGSMWAADSPRLLFELFEYVDDTGLGALMTEFLGERPLLSGLKATLRRMPPDVDVDGRWHQDGSFLGQGVGAVNIWLALSACGTDAPGLDILPTRLARVISRDESSRYDWALSDDAVTATAAEVPIVRPEFEAGDALLFDHLLLHRTGTSPGMKRERHAIESWFFAPSAYPTDQLPILY
jgi:hypothetical protein